MPSNEEILDFATNNSKSLNGLSFAARRAIVLLVVEKITGTKEGIHVFGCIPINQMSHSSLAIGIAKAQTDIPERNYYDSIPFDFAVKLPLPLKTGVDYGFRANTSYPS